MARNVATVIAPLKVTLPQNVRKLPVVPPNQRNR